MPGVLLDLILRVVNEYVEGFVIALVTLKSC